MMTLSLSFCSVAAPLSSSFFSTQDLIPGRISPAVPRPFSARQAGQSRSGRFLCEKTLSARVAAVGIRRRSSSSSLCTRYNDGSVCSPKSGTKRSLCSTRIDRLLFPRRPASAPPCFLSPSLLRLSHGRTREQEEGVSFLSSFSSSSSVPSCMDRTSESHCFSSESQHSFSFLSFLYQAENRSRFRRGRVSGWLEGDRHPLVLQHERMDVQKRIRRGTDNERETSEEGHRSLCSSSSSSFASASYRSGLGGLEMKVKVPVPALKPRTRKSIAKRFKITATGKLLYRHSGRQHLMRKKPGQRRRRLRKVCVLTGKMASKFLSCIHTPRARIRRRKKKPQPVYKF